MAKVEAAGTRVSSDSIFLKVDAGDAAAFGE